MKQNHLTPNQPKGFAPIILIFITGIVIFIVLALNFFAIPYRASESNLPIFKNGEIILAEKLTYLFRKPEAGDRVAFKKPGDSTIVYFGTILDRPRQSVNISIGEDGHVVSEDGYDIAWGEHPEEFGVGRSRIISRIYYPVLSQEVAEKEATKTVLDARYKLAKECTEENQGSKTQFLVNTTDWKTYKNDELKFSFQYPPHLKFTADKWFDTIPPSKVMYDVSLEDKNVGESINFNIRPNPSTRYGPVNKPEDFLGDGADEQISSQFQGFAAVRYKPHNEANPYGIYPTTKSINMVILKDRPSKILFSISGQVTTENKNCLENYRELDQILSTFKFIK